MSQRVECDICKGTLGSDSPGRIGLLKDCQHVFCAICLIKCKVHANQQPTCPCCRTPFSGIIIWHQVVHDSEEKEELFYLQNPSNLKNPVNGPSGAPTLEELAKQVAKRAPPPESFRGDQKAITVQTGAITWIMAYGQGEAHPGDINQVSPLMYPL